MKLLIVQSFPVSQTPSVYVHSKFYLHAYKNTVLYVLIFMFLREARVFGNFNRSVLA
jgi:hypothetical protein